MKMIELKDVSKKIKRKVILDEVNFTIDKGSICGFSGPNGSGKSMIFKAIIGFLNPDKGTVIVNGKQIRKDELFSSDIAFSMDNEGVLEDFSARKNLELINLLNNNQQTKDEIKQLLEYVGLKSDETKVKDFSLGMKKRLSLACALISNSPIIILDEPTNALDEKGKEFLKRLIFEQNAEGKTVLVSSHDRLFLEEISDKIIYVSDGKIVE
ncbi:ABC transporter ATP-binding protein [Carnobacterium gallinarum]|uniref:ABC transporter ATP-binding protein n=1 Tax=Carnobacterium gallinarum TaxID=2749 RepID=UPI000557F100|nr:ATP-binding cassette domain-containing protein [Carnobacterium gallinarum]